MQIVIEVSEKDFKRLEQFGFIPDLWFGVYQNAILNGTLLPKHHGRLIDADNIEVIRVRDNTREYNKGFNAGVNSVVNKILDAPTIIEATGVKE